MPKADVPSYADGGIQKLTLTKEFEEQLKHGLELAIRDGNLELGGPKRKDPKPLFGPVSLAADQSGFQDQQGRDTCWAFAGAAALEAAYHRKYGISIKVSEQYIFHMGKAPALNLQANTNLVAWPRENNSSYEGFQGCSDVVQKLSARPVPDARFAPYLSGNQMDNLATTIGYPGLKGALTQEDWDLLEFDERHIPLEARVNACYRVTAYKSLGDNPSIEALENTLLAGHEVVIDVPNHTTLIIGFDSIRQMWLVKNSGGENRILEWPYATTQILSAHYIEDVAPVAVQPDPMWMGNWELTIGDQTSRVLIRRTEDYGSPGQATRLGTAFTSRGPFYVNGLISDGGRKLKMHIADTAGDLAPGTLNGTPVTASLSSTDPYIAKATAAGLLPATMRRLRTRIATLWIPANGVTWRANHAVAAEHYQAHFDEMAKQGFRLRYINGYWDGATLTYSTIWVHEPGPEWITRHALTDKEYLAEFETQSRRGMRLVHLAPYGFDGQVRYATIWERRPGEIWQARHGLDGPHFETEYAQLVGVQGYEPAQITGYRVGVATRFAGLWVKRTSPWFESHTGQTVWDYEADVQRRESDGQQMTWLSAYSQSGAARFSTIWRKGALRFAARHGIAPADYQTFFDSFAEAGLRPLVVCRYGDAVL